MNGRLSHILAVTRRAFGMALRRHAPIGTVGQGTATGRDSRSAREGAGAWDRPISEIIAGRSVRVSNRDADTIAAYRRIHTILSRGRA